MANFLQIPLELGSIPRSFRAILFAETQGRRPWRALEVAHRKARTGRTNAVGGVKPRNRVRTESARGSDGWTLVQSTGDWFALLAALLATLGVVVL